MAKKTTSKKSKKYSSNGYTSATGHPVFVEEYAAPAERYTSATGHPVFVEYDTSKGNLDWF